MDLLQPRRAYHRANTEDNGINDPIEMSSMNSSKSGFKTDFTDDWTVYDGKSDSKYQYSELALSEYSNDFHLRANQSDQVPLIQPSLRARWFSGWRSGAYSAACLSLISLLINLTAAIWLQRHPDSDDSGLVEVYNGSCKEVSSMDVWVHLAINAISTLLLGGSNYCMQCLCAPTRKEVDKAHAKGRYLDIGVPSYRNLSSISRPRVILWWILGLSSIPLHLMYNSAFYSSLATNDYYIYFVTPEFLEGGNATFTADIGGGVAYDGKEITAEQLQEQISSNTTYKFERLEPLACIQQYAQVFLANRRNLVFVSSNTTKTDSTVLGGAIYSFGNDVGGGGSVEYKPFDWICTSDPLIDLKITVPPDTIRGGTPPCDSWVDRIESVADKWQPFGWTVDYCLAEIVEDQCSFNGNLPIVVVVIFANAFKAIVMLIVAYRLPGDHTPLITLGDSIESFLDVPDSTTEGVCYLTREQAALYALVNPYREFKPTDTKWKGVEKIDAKGQIKRLKPVRWSQSASRMRWILTIGLIVGALLMVIGFMVPAIQAIKDFGANIQDLGFGTVHASAVITGWSIDTIKPASMQIIAAIFIANLPQAILSFLYLNLNGLLTSFWLNQEWSLFANHRKYLRVSTPKGLQRSTHFLQLPYKVAIPLMTVSGLLHWLISQSIFLAVVAEYGAVQGNLISPVQIASCGFSPMAMIMVLVAGTVMILITFAIGRFKYDPSMPLVGSCSAAIAAACHRPDWDIDAGTSAVQWGVIPGSDDADGIGHCCFTSGSVKAVEDGKEYAGFRRSRLEAG